jgi:hypothetical protein
LIRVFALSSMSIAKAISCLLKFKRFQSYADLLFNAVLSRLNVRIEQRGKVLKVPP